MENPALGKAAMSDWVAQPYIHGRNMVMRPLPAIITKRAWYAATIQQTPVIQNFLQCIKNYFAVEAGTTTDDNTKVFTETLSRR